MILKPIIKGYIRIDMTQLSRPKKIRSKEIQV